MTTIFALAAEVFKEIARFAVSDLEIVGTDIGNEAAGQRIGYEHDRDFRVVELLYRIDHRDVIDGDEDDGVRPVLQDVLDHRLLFVDIVRLLGNVMHGAGFRRARDLVGGDAERLIGRIGRILGEDGDGHLLVRRLGVTCE